MVHCLLLITSRKHRSNCDASCLNTISRHSFKTYAKFSENCAYQCLYCKLWTYFTPCSNVSIVNFEQVNAGWEVATAYTIYQTQSTWQKLRILLVLEKSQLLVLLRTLLRWYFNTLDLNSLNFLIWKGIWAAEILLWKSSWFSLMFRPSG